MIDSACIHQCVYTVVFILRPW